MPVSFNKLTITAPAKVNLHLAVKNRRPDGFHNLESIFWAVNFGDTLHFEPVEGENSFEIIMEGLDLGLPMEKNIIFRAFSLFRSKTSFNQGLRIRVEKRIPLGGGLGGGSSDAASTLLALNKLTGSPLTREALLEMGASLGSDIPFFIHETAAARVTGRGECIEPIDVPRCFLVLVNPGFPSDTAAAFRLLDIARSQKVSDTILTTNHTNQHEQEFLDESWFNFKIFLNDFLDVFNEPEKSVYNNIISQLRELGADFSGLSGAGSTCFGVFREKPLAEKAAAAMRKAWGFVECTFPRGCSETSVPGTASYKKTSQNHQY